MPAATDRPVSRWLLLAVALASALAALAVALGPMRLQWRDRDAHVVRLGWDASAGRLLVNAPIREPLALDGPYVRRRADGQLEVMEVVERAGDGGGWRAQVRLWSPRPAPVITVRVDNPARTRFDVVLRPIAEPPPATAAMPARLLLVSDVEGAFDPFVALLQAQGVVDAQLHWRYGAGQLVVAGDLVDRGEHMLPLLWLVYRLQAEAQRAGGRVHVVLGNHELLNLQGRLRYAPRRLFASRDAFFGGENSRVFGEDTVLGQWLRVQPVMVRVGEVLVVHGGISRAFLARALDIEAANAIARDGLAGGDRFLDSDARLVLGKLGPPGYRGMARPEKAIELDALSHLDAVLARYDARRIAIGHSRLPQATVQHGGRLLRLDVDHARGPSQALLLEGGGVYRVDAAGGRRRLQ